MIRAWSRFEIAVFFSVLKFLVPAPVFPPSFDLVSLSSPIGSFFAGRSALAEGGFPDSDLNRGEAPPHPGRTKEDQAIIVVMLAAAMSGPAFPPKTVQKSPDLRRGFR